MNQFAPPQPQGIEGFTVEPTSEAWDMTLKIWHQKVALTHRAKQLEAFEARNRPPACQVGAPELVEQVRYSTGDRIASGLL